MRRRQDESAGSRGNAYVVLLLRDLGALETLRVEGVANLEILRVRRKALEELVVDLLVHVDAGTCAAALAVVEAIPRFNITVERRKRSDILDTERSPLDGLVQVRVVEDDRRALASELKRDLLQVRLGSCLHDLATDERAARERDL